jgi:hypothetical protein
MIRETIETLGPPGALPSRDTVLFEHGPEPIHEGQAIVDALRKLLAKALSASRRNLLDRATRSGGNARLPENRSVAAAPCIKRALVGRYAARPEWLTGGTKVQRRRDENLKPLFVIADAAGFVADRSDVRLFRYRLSAARLREIIADRGDLTFLHPIENPLAQWRAVLLLQRSDIRAEEGLRHVRVEYARLGVPAERIEIAIFKAIRAAVEGNQRLGRVRFQRGGSFLQHGLRLARRAEICGVRNRSSCQREGKRRYRANRKCTKHKCSPERLLRASS